MYIQSISVTSRFPLVRAQCGLASYRRSPSGATGGRRFTTYERIEEIQFMVVKKDGRREPFDRNKILSGLLKATQKRPVSVAELEKIADEVEARLMEKPDREISSHEIGELIVNQLYHLDEVAYVRFASVYRQFRDVNEFVEEVKGLLGTTQRRPRRS